MFIQASHSCFTGTATHNLTASGYAHSFRRYLSLLLLMTSLLIAGCGGGGGSGGGSGSPSPKSVESLAATNSKLVATGSCNTVKQNNQTTDFVGQLNASGYETPSMLTFSLLNPDGSDAGQTLTTAKGGIVTITDPTTGLFTYQADTRPGDRGVEILLNFRLATLIMPLLGLRKQSLLTRPSCCWGIQLPMASIVLGVHRQMAGVLLMAFFPSKRLPAIARHYTKA